MATETDLLNEITDRSQRAAIRRVFGVVGSKTELGFEFDGYPLTGFVGAGRYGAVFAARGPDGGPLAVKVFDIDSTKDEAGLLSLVREAAAGMRVCSDSIARYHALVVKAPPASMPDAAPAYYLVRELAPGKPLTFDPSANADHVAGVIRCLARGLCDLHDRYGLVHQDIKPENAVADGPRAMWIDLGQVRLALTSGYGHAAARRAWRHTDPPEAWRNNAFDPSQWKRPGDVFAFGVTLFRLLTGEWPWEKYPHAELERSKYGLLNRPLPIAGMADVVRGMLRIDPASRPTMSGVVRDLNRGS